MTQYNFEHDKPDDAGLLAEQRLGRLGLEVKLDKGFAEGTYYVYVEFDQSAGRVGFAAARRTAEAYCALLKGNLTRAPGYTFGAIQDGSRTADPSRRRDLEATFLWFELRTDDGRYHDQAVGDHFRVVALRAGQVWDQLQAKAVDQRRQQRQQRLRGQLYDLLDAPAYAHLDPGTKERLLRDIIALACPAPGIGR